MLIKIKTVYGDVLHIMADDLAKAQAKGRKFVKIYTRAGKIKTEKHGGILCDCFLHIDNITTQGSVNHV